MKKVILMVALFMMGMSFTASAQFGKKIEMPLLAATVVYASALG